MTREEAMTRRGIIWVAVVLVLIFAAIYVFNSRRSGTASTWVLWEKTMTMKDGKEWRGGYCDIYTMRDGKIQELSSYIVEYK